MLNASAAALGRQTDALIVATAMDAGANATANRTTQHLGRLQKQTLLALFETMGTADVPEDGQRYVAMSPAGYADLFNIN